MGLATALALQTRGYQVSVLERFSHVHTYGSHSGHTRVIRQAYNEGQFYVPLVRRAQELWRDLEGGDTGSLMVETGMLEFGPPDDPSLRDSIEACRACAVDHQLLTPQAVRERWPVVYMPDTWQAMFSRGAGYLRVAACLTALRKAALQAGATFEYGVRVRELCLGQTSVRVLLDSGEVRAGEHAVICCGAYTKKLCPGTFDGLLSISRRVLAWTTPKPEQCPQLAQLPVWGAYTPDGFFYGFPWGDSGVTGFKLACHNPRGAPDPEVDPDTLDREVHPHDLAPIDRFLDLHLPAGKGPTAATATCMYTRTGSDNFLIDRHPDDPRVVVATGFSGHGFKFAPAIGELVAELVERGTGGPIQPAFSRRQHLRERSATKQRRDLKRRR